MIPHARKTCVLYSFNLYRDENTPKVTGNAAETLFGINTLKSFIHDRNITVFLFFLRRHITKYLMLVPAPPYSRRLFCGRPSLYPLATQPIGNSRELSSMCEHHSTRDYFSYNLLLVCQVVVNKDHLF